VNKISNTPSTSTVFVITKKITKRKAEMTDWVHPNEGLPVLGIADINQPIEFS